MLQLVDAYWKPLLLYGSEVYWRAKSCDSASRTAWNYTFWKIFGVSEKVACDIHWRIRLIGVDWLIGYWQQCNSLLKRLVCLPVTVSLCDFMFAVLVDVILMFYACVCVCVSF